MNTANEIPGPEDGRIVIAGDWHGDTAWMRQALHHARSAGHTHLIHVGDLGVLWPEDRRGPVTPKQHALMPSATEHDPFTWQLVRLLDKWSMTMHFIDGNRDNHPELRALPRDQNGFGIISDRLKYISRGHRWNIGGVRFAGLGGAYSINKMRLTHGLNWWPEEVVTPEDLVSLGAGGVDVLITHEVPAGIDTFSAFTLPALIEAQANASRILISDAARQTSARLVFSGHWHQRLTQQLPGAGADVHVLDMNGRPENMVVLDLATLDVSPFRTMVQMR